MNKEQIIEKLESIYYGPERSAKIYIVINQVISALSNSVLLSPKEGAFAAIAAMVAKKAMPESSRPYDSLVEVIKPQLKKKPNDPSLFHNRS